MDEISAKLLQKLEEKFRSNKDLPIWKHNEPATETWGLVRYPNLLKKTAESKCSKNITIPDLRNIIIKQSS